MEKLFRVPGVKMIYRMEGVYTLKPEISYREAGKEHFGLYVDADTELLAEDIMAAVPSVTSVSEKNAITNYTGMGTGETYTKYSYDVAVDWDANIENKPAALLDLVKQFGKVDGVQYALPRSPILRFMSLLRMTLFCIRWRRPLRRKMLWWVI
ncbi:MAG: hypothetical protein ACLT29_00050 [Ruminococcus callidus]